MASISHGRESTVSVYCGCLCKQERNRRFQGVIHLCNFRPVGWSESYPRFHWLYCLALHWLGSPRLITSAVLVGHVNFVLCVLLNAIFKLSHVPGPAEQCLEELSCTLRISNFWYSFNSLIQSEQAWETIWNSQCQGRWKKKNQLCCNLPWPILLQHFNYFSEILWVLVSYPCGSIN